MKIFMIEWWQERGAKYNQEYYLDPIIAANRFKMLKDSDEDSDPNLTSIWVDTQSSDSE